MLPKQTALQAELHGLQVMIATMLSFAIKAEPDKEKAVSYLRKSIEMSAASALLKPVPENHRAEYRIKMRVSALQVLAMAASPQTTKDQH